MASRTRSYILHTQTLRSHYNRLEFTRTQQLVLPYLRLNFSAHTMSEGKTLLTIAETAELLNCSSGFVRKRIALSEACQLGGWPKTTYVNLQPNGAKSLYRINKAALEAYLQSSSNAKVEVVTEAPAAEASVI